MTWYNFKSRFQCYFSFVLVQASWNPQGLVLCLNLRISPFLRDMLVRTPSLPYIKVCNSHNIFQTSLFFSWLQCGRVTGISYPSVVLKYRLAFFCSFLKLFLWGHVTRHETMTYLVIRAFSKFMLKQALKRESKVKPLPVSSLPPTSPLLLNRDKFLSVIL